MKPAMMRRRDWRKQIATCFDLNEVDEVACCSPLAVQLPIGHVRANFVGLAVTIPHSLFSCYGCRDRPEDAPMYGSLTDLTRRRLGLAALAALVVCAALSPASAQAPSSRPSVAVLPLETSDAAQAFFAEGMTDEIAAALTGVLGLDVVARSSSFQLKPPNRD